MKGTVFLGGSCGSSTWRISIAIPLLKKAGIPFYNPQLKERLWEPNMRFEDIKAKREADVFLFVINDQTRGVASIGEVSYLIGQGKPLALALVDVSTSTTINKQSLTTSEIEDLNRGRLFLRDIATAHNVPVFTSIKEAVVYSVKLANGINNKLSIDKLKAIVAQISYRDMNCYAEEIVGGFLIHLKKDVRNTTTGQMEVMQSRKWFVNESELEADIVKTVFKAVLTWEEHEVREWFTYKNKVLFDPHVPL